MKASPLTDALTDIDDRHIAEAAAVRRPAARRLRRVAVIALAAALCLMLALPALAAADSTYPLLYAVSPALAQRFKPVRLACEDNGVRMEVAAVSVEGDTAEAYITLQDMEGDRIDASTDLFDSWSFRTPFDSMGTCQLEGYDPETRTALFHVLARTMGGEDIRPDSGRLTFSCGEFLSRKQAFEGVDLTSVLRDLPSRPALRTDVSLRGWDNGSAGIPFLDAGGAALLTIADGVSVTAAGYVDGKLHVQVYYADILRTDNHGFLYLVGREGERPCDMSLSFWDDARTGSYEEYIFELPEDELAGYALQGDFYTSGCHTEGNWQVTFPLDGE